MPALISNTKTFSATGTLVLDVRDAHYAAVTIVGSFVATVAFEVSNNQTDWFSINVTPSASPTPVSSATAPGGFAVNVQPWAYLRANCSSYTSGAPATAIYAMPIAGL